MRQSVVIAEPGYRGTTAPLIGEYRDVFKKASEIGFDAVQLTVNRPEEQPAELINELCAAYGLQISAIATGLAYGKEGLCLASSDRENRLAAVERMLGHIELAAKLGYPKVIIGAIRGFMEPGMTEAQYRELFADSCSRVLDAAAKKGVTVITEAMDRYESNVMLPADETAAFIRSFGTPYFKLQLDTMHSYYEGEDLAAAILRHGDLVAQVDLSGAARAVPKDGTEIDYAAVLAALKKIGYGEYLIHEYMPDAEGENARAGLGYIRSLLKA